MPNVHSRVIFLDIDGVMTSMLEFPGSYLRYDPDNYGISPSKVKLLLKLCDKTDSYVIISSNWRNFPIDGTWKYDGKEYRNPLASLITVLGSRFIGTLPKCRHTSKSDVLRKWFVENSEYSCCSYVIFDDDRREGFAESEFYLHFIQTDKETGLSKDDCLKAELLLK